MKLLIKTVCLFTVAVVLVSMSFVSAGAVSSVPYNGYSYDVKGYDIDAPVGYVPDKTYFGADFGMKDSFGSLNDMFIYNNETIYLCDSHKDSTDTEDMTADRIVVLDKNYQFVRQYTEFVDKKTGKKYPLVNPQSVFVTDDEIFVCCDIQNSVKTESGSEETIYNGYCVAGDYNGNFTRIFTNPASYSPIVESKHFRPFGVVEDNSGYIYIRSQDELNGLLVFSAEGQFLQYFGANQVELTFDLIIQQMWKKIFSREAADTLQKAVPTEMSSIFVDDEGFIYTTTASTTVDKALRVRKLNAAGTNILKGDENATLELSYGDYFVKAHYSMWNSSLVDAFVDQNDVIAVLDQNYGRVFLYDQQATLLTIFGYKEINPMVKNGSTVIPVAVAKNDDRYLILDRGQKAIVTYRPTDYIQKLLDADEYYMRGWYVDGESYWREVLKYDANNVRAYAAIGKSLLEKEQYQEALEYLKKGYDRTSYSTAYAEYRREYIRSNYWWLIPLIVVIIVAFVNLFKLIRKLLGFKDEKKKIRFH